MPKSATVTQTTTTEYLVGATHQQAGRCHPGQLRMKRAGDFICSVLGLDRFQNRAPSKRIQSFAIIAV